MLRARCSARRQARVTSEAMRQKYAKIPEGRMEAEDRRRLEALGNKVTLEPLVIAS